MRIYVASKTRHLPFWQALRAANVPIVASWIDSAINAPGAEASSDDWAEHWTTCVREASEADIVLLYATRRARCRPLGSRQGGREGIRANAQKALH